MEPILIPAFPAVLRAGMPCVVEYEEYETWVFLGLTTDGALQFARSSPAAILPSRMSIDESVASVRLDLRDAAVRDAVVRAVWRKLRPTEPEPLTAPSWSCSYPPGHVPDEIDDERPCWYLGPDGDALTFVDAEDGPVDDDTVFVAGLDEIMLRCSPDRDLLALAAVACAVLA